MTVAPNGPACCFRRCSGGRPESSATWFVAEGAEEVKGASSMPIAKAMGDCIIATTERRALRPSKVSMRIVVPGFKAFLIRSGCVASRSLTVISEL